MKEQYRKADLAKANFVKDDFDDNPESLGRKIRQVGTEINEKELSNDIKEYEKAMDAMNKKNNKYKHKNHN